jgi:hypothetical protein
VDASYWAVALDRAMLTYFEVGPHARFERHAHDSEQITFVLEGQLVFAFDDRRVTVGPGDLPPRGRGRSGRRPGGRCVEPHPRGIRE